MTSSVEARRNGSTSISIRRGMAVAESLACNVENSKCPVSGKDVDPAHVVVFEGKAVGLCCDKCEAKFKADPKQFIDKFVADVK